MNLVKINKGFTGAVTEDFTLATIVRSDRALKISNARILSAVYFGLLAVVFTLSLDATFYALGVYQVIPLFEGTLLAMFTASVFGAIFGEKIVHCPPPYKWKVFVWGWLMTIMAMPFYDLGFLFFYLSEHSDFFQRITAFNIFRLYVFILIQSFVLIEFWLGIMAGLAAIYLRSRIIYYIYDSKDD